LSRTLWAIQDARERSFALFGHKAAAISSLYELYIDHGQSNWDGEGAVPTSPAALETAIWFIRVLPDHLPMPEIAAEPDGAISLDWACSRHRVFTLSIGTTDRLAYAWLDGSDRGHGVARFDGERVPQKIIEGIEGATREDHLPCPASAVCESAWKSIT
jgi:hypothetical protein